MNPRLRTATAADSGSVSALLQTTFDAFVATDWEPEARAVFMADSSPDRVASAIAQATFASLAESENQVVGFLLMPRPTLLGYLFVHQAWHRRGIAKELWEAARAYLESEQPEVKTVELNSSPFAVQAYRAMGFYPNSEPFRRGGCLATRMACWLPGRALASGANAA